METLIAFLFAAIVTFFFVRSYLKKLTQSQKSAAKVPAGAAPAAQHPCPRCGKPIARDAAFCSHCGAAMAMWSVHRATVQSVSSAATGKPRPVINASLCVGCASCVHACPEQGTLEMLSGKALLSHPDRCTGHAKCAEVCPTNAISLAVGGVLQTLRVPHVKEDFETNVPGVFIVGELAGMGLIKTAINEGKLVMDHIRQRIQKCGPAPGPASGGNLFDVVIVGSGPAGLSASLAAHQYGLRYLTLEQGEIAATIRQYPRQKFLMAEPIEMPLYGALYVADGTKEALLSVWETILKNTGVQVQTNERVEQVRRNGQGFHVDTPSGQYHTRYVILAMGRRGTPRRLGVPGEHLAKVSYRLIEAETYQDHDLLVVGGGDSAIEAALALSRLGKNRVTLSYRGADFQRSRARNQQMLREAERDEKIRIVRNSQVLEILPEAVTLEHQGRREQLRNHFTFIAIGGQSPEEFLRKTGIEIVEKCLAL